MRIQLRDCNPPHRGIWKYGRGRGKYQHYGTQRHSAELGDHSIEMTYSDVRISRDERQEVRVEEQHGETSGGDGMYASAPEFPTLDKAATSERADLENTPVQDESEIRRSSDSHPGTRRSSPDKPSTARETPSDAYREWYDDPSSTAITPPPSSFGSSASATAPFVPYPMANSGYYPPQSWVPPLPQHFSYPMPYMPSFPGFANPPAPSFASTTGSDSSGPAAGTQNAWGGVYSVRRNLRVYARMLTPSVAICAVPRLSHETPQQRRSLPISATPA